MPTESDQPPWHTGNLPQPLVKDSEVAESPKSAQLDLLTQNFRDVLHFMNGEWIPDVLVTLKNGPKLYTDLLYSVRANTCDDGWSDKHHRYLQESVLNRTLRRMEQTELIQRRRDSEFPYRVSYRLTSAADRLLHLMAPAVSAWCSENAELVVRAQQHPRRRPE
ncbi:winged helix-turn-helix transcriptional regulator [Streptomyces sp. NPDC054796]